jgi:hypothetical protein
MKATMPAKAGKIVYGRAGVNQVSRSASSNV